MINLTESIAKLINYGNDTILNREGINSGSNIREVLNNIKTIPESISYYIPKIYNSQGDYAALYFDFLFPLNPFTKEDFVNSIFISDKSNVYTISAIEPIDARVVKCSVDLTGITFVNIISAKTNLLSFSADDKIVPSFAGIVNLLDFERVKYKISESVKSSELNPLSFEQVNLFYSTSFNIDAVDSTLVSAINIFKDDTVSLS